MKYLDVLTDPSRVIGEISFRFSIYVRSQIKTFSSRIRRAVLLLNYVKVRHMTKNKRKKKI